MLRPFVVPGGYYVPGAVEPPSNCTDVFGDKVLGISVGIIFQYNCTRNLRVQRGKLTINKTVTIAVTTTA